MRLSRALTASPQTVPGTISATKSGGGWTPMSRRSKVRVLFPGTESKSPVGEGDAELDGDVAVPRHPQDVRPDDAEGIADRDQAGTVGVRFRKAGRRRGGAAERGIRQDGPGPDGVLTAGDGGRRSCSSGP